MKKIPLVLLAGLGVSSLVALGSLAADKSSASHAKTSTSTMAALATSAPVAATFALGGFLLVSFAPVRRGAKTLALVGALAMTSQMQAAIPTTDLPLNVTLQPNSTYTVSADITVSAVGTLLGLLGLGDNPLQILDGSGNVIGTLPAQSLIDLLTGLTGQVTRQLDLVINTAGTSVINPVLRVLSSPLISITNPVVSSPSPSPAVNNRPTVRIVSHKHRERALRLVGKAADDGRIGKVEVFLNGKIKRVSGKASFSAKLRLKQGMNRIIVRAFDDTGKVSLPKRLKVKMPKSA